MTDTFLGPAPSIGASGTGKLALRRAVFGEGYVQEAGDGPNNERQTWPLAWTLSLIDASNLMVFIRSHAAGQKFFWTPPLGVQGYYVILGYKIDALGNNTFAIHATFDQRFSP